MGLGRYAISCCVVLSILGCWLRAQVQAGQSSALVPQLVNFSGKATDGQGQPIAGIVGITFSIYKDQYEGAAVDGSAERPGGCEWQLHRAVGRKQGSRRGHKESRYSYEYSGTLFRRVLVLPLGGDQHTGIEDQSHAGGSSGSRWLSIAASTSLAKSASMTAVESSGKSAMHSEMVRRGGAGAWIIATGSLPLSITTSAPARTRASTSAKLLTASASEMWITWSAMARLYRHTYFNAPPGPERAALSLRIPTQLFCSSDSCSEIFSLSTLRCPSSYRMKSSLIFPFWLE